MKHIKLFENFSSDWISFYFSMEDTVYFGKLSKRDNSTNTLLSLAKNWADTKGLGYFDSSDEGDISYVSMNDGVTSFVKDSEISDINQGSYIVHSSGEIENNEEGDGTYYFELSPGIMVAKELYHGGLVDSDTPENLIKMLESY